MSRHLLFLCSGNYYRSRFAEILFNHLAQQNGLDWTADSRGIIAQSSYNPGPISPSTLRGLAARNISMDTPRDPIQLEEGDLTRADRVIALYDREHLALLKQYFPNHPDRVEFWQVPDLDEMDAEQALALIEYNVRDLLRGLVQEAVGKEEIS